MRGEPDLVAMVRVYLDRSQWVHHYRYGRVTLMATLAAFPPRRQESLKPFRYAINVYLKDR